MSAHKHPHVSQLRSGQSGERVTTVISCPGVRPMLRNELRSPTNTIANENQWFDFKGARRRGYANFAGVILAGMMLWGGVWIVGEFVRLQKLEACYEAGRRDCLPLDMNHKAVRRPG